MKTHYQRTALLAVLSLSALLANSFGLSDARVLRAGDDVVTIGSAATAGVSPSTLATRRANQPITSRTLPGVIETSQTVQPLATGSSSDFCSSSLQITRRGHTTVPLADGRIVIIGGQNQDGLVDATEILEPESQLITVTARLNTPRSRHTATPLPDGRVLVAGGWDQKHLLDSSEVFDPATDSFSSGPRLVQARAAHNATVLPDGRILITGGVPEATAEIIDPTTNISTLLEARMTAARSFHGAIVLNDTSVLLVGGVDQDGQPLRSAEIFNTRTLRFFPTIKPMNISRARPAMRLLKDGKVQIIGGDHDGTMEIYDADKDVFAAPAHIVPTLDIFSASKVMFSQTRGAFIDVVTQPRGNANVKGPEQKQPYSSTVEKALDSFDDLLDRADYSATEIPYLNQAVIAGGVNRKGEYVQSVITIKSSPASITTGEVEYAAGERVLISGSGFQPNEAIRIVRQEARPTHMRTYLQSVANENGDFINSEISIGDYEPGVTYTLTAMGESSTNVAQTVYKNALSLSTEGRRKPKGINISIPILFRDASYELEEGILIWRAVSGLKPQVKPPETPEISIHRDFSHTFTFSEVVGKPCLGVGLCPAGIDVRLREGSFLTVSGSLDVTLDFGVAKVVASEAISGNVTFEITARGTVNLPDIPIPFASIGFQIDFGRFSAGITIGIVAKIQLTFTDPGTQIVTGFGFSQNATLGLKFIRHDIEAIANSDGNFDPVFNLVRTGGGCIKISIGPKIGVNAEFDLPGPFCNPGLNASAFAGGFIKVCLNLSGTDACRRYDVPLHVGAEYLVEGKADVCLFDPFGGSSGEELFREEITSFASGVLRDTSPPVLTCPTSITQSNDFGRCSAVVNYSPAGATDSCSGVRFVGCVPPSGSTFAVGVTPVTCTAIDNAFNISTCTFTVTVENRQGSGLPCGQQFDVCVQDDRTRNFLRLNSSTGVYQFTRCSVRGGFTLTGVGLVRTEGSVITLEHNSGDRTVVAQIDSSTNRGTATAHLSPLGVPPITVTISDTNTANNNQCACFETGELPDLVPEPLPGTPNPTLFCRLDGSGRLVVRVRNQGSGVSGPTVTRVEFLPGRFADLVTPSIPPGGAIDLVVPLGFLGCFTCEFKITVDSGKAVDESDEGNNTVDGRCIG